MKKLIATIMAAGFLALSGVPVHAQRVMDKLGRGLVAVKAENGMFVSWRVLGEDARNLAFNLYRDGVKLNSEPLTVSNFTDAAGTPTSVYTVKEVVNGVEGQAQSAILTSATDYIDIPVAAVPANKDGQNISHRYEPNDATIADLDGDGEMELLIKMRSLDDIELGYPENGTEFDIIQVYKLDGTLMWWIDCGRNMADFQSNEINIAAYDWDLDGKAECVLRGADGMVVHQSDGTNFVVGDPKVNTRNELLHGGGQTFTHSGAEYLLYLNGETGKPYVCTEYPLKRLEDGETDLNAAWGDGYGHRSTKHFFGAPYLDGRKPSIFLARGIYTRHKMIALDVDPATHQLVERWRWNVSSWSPWMGQGYHNYSIADVDWDGRDEIIFGSMTIDDNGHGLSTSGLGHGDSMHVGNFNPYQFGQEVAACNEAAPSNNYRNATTSKIYYRNIGTADDGRAIAGNFTNEFPGASFITAKDAGSLISCVYNNHIPSASATGDVAQNFRIYWDGDLLSETFNYTNGKNTAGAIYKYKAGKIKVFDGTATNNDTKGTPCMQADIFGDWREEVIMRTDDNKSIRICTTTVPTEHRIYTLLHDPQYRNAMVWQMNGYNQTPHTSFFLGEVEGITQAPPAPTMNGRVEVTNSLTAEANGKEAILATVGDATLNVQSGVTPSVLYITAPCWTQGHDDNDNITTDYYTHTLTGSLSGATRLVKTGAGVMKITEPQQHSGETEVWFGTMQFDKNMPNSPLWLNRLTRLESNGGVFGKGITADYGAVVAVGPEDGIGTIETSVLKLNFGAELELDLYADGLKSDTFKADELVLESKDWKYGPKYSAPVIRVKPHLLSGATSLDAGQYVIGNVAKVTGNLDDVKIEGLSGQKAKLGYADGKLVIDIEAMRAPADIIWTGANGSDWDLAETENFKMADSGEATAFVTGDRVTFDDSAATDQIVIAGEVLPSSIVFNNSEKNLVVTGNGFTGTLNIEKKGTGRVQLKNKSSFRGDITINNGTLEAATVGSDEGEENGSFGHYSNVINVAKGATVSIATGSRCSHNFVITEGNIEVKNGSLALANANVTGNSTVTKLGAGELKLAGGTKVQRMIVKEGSIGDAADAHQLGSNIVIDGKNISINHQNSTSSYSSDAANYEVTEGSTGTLWLDGRCEYNGKLTGKGALTVRAQFVRNNMNGNWSDFEGTIIAGQGTSGAFDFCNKYGLPKAHLEVLSGCTFKNTKTDGNTAGTQKMQIGALSGAGNVAGLGKFLVGANNEDTMFDGEFKEVGLVKQGTGTLVLSLESTTMTGVDIEAGTLELRQGDKKTDAMLGTKAMTVSGALTGRATLKNTKTTVTAGGVLHPTHTKDANSNRKFTFTKLLTMEEGSKFVSDVFSKTNYGKLIVEGTADLGGATVEVVLKDKYAPAIGDELTLWTAAKSEKLPKMILPALPDGMVWDKSGLTPTAGVLKVASSVGVEELAANEELSLTVTSLDGLRICSGKTTAGTARATLDRLPAGVYVVTMHGELINRNYKLRVK